MGSETEIKGAVYNLITEQRYKKIKVWKFNEASEDLQEKILENYRDFNTVDNFWIEGDWLLPYEIFSWSSSKIYFDLDRGQYVDFNDLQIKNNNMFWRLLRLDDKTVNKTTDIYFTHKDQSNTEIEFKDLSGSEIYLDNFQEYLEYNTEKKDQLTRKQFERLQKAKSIFDDLISEAWNSLNKSYEYEISDEAIKENLIANDYDFNECGKID